MPIGDLNACRHSCHICSVIERTGGHAGIRYDIGTTFKESRHIRSGISGFVRAKVEVLTALTLEVINVLLQKCIAIISGSFIIYIEIVISCIACVIHNRFSMSRHIEHRNDLNIFTIGIVYDRVHVILCKRPCIAIETIITISNISLYRIARHCDAAKRQTHIVQQESASTVSKRKLKLIIAVLSHSIDQLFDICNTEIFASAVKMYNAIRRCSFCRCGERYDRCDGQYHQHCKKHRCQTRRPACHFVFKV